MASNLRVDTILPSTGLTLGIGTASGTINFLGNSNIVTTGNVSIGGTLTYEDVTNVDSVGVITARAGINATGVSTFTSDVRMRTSTSNTDVVIGNISQGNFNRGTLAIKASADQNSTPLDANIYLEERDGSEGYTLSVDSDGDLNFHNSGSTAPTLEVKDDNNVAITNGNLVIGTAGKGIDFSAQTASSLSGVSVSSELLDHYEEGTFTPTFGASNGSSTAGYSVQTGKYTRIGNIVHVQIYIALSSLSTNSHSHAWISGLPVAPAERTATSSIMCGGMQNSGYTSFPIAGRTGASATRIELFQATNGGVTDFSTSSVSGTAYFILQCTYRAN